MKILVAEDDLVSRRMLTKMLENWGHQVTACVNGSEAWNNFLSERHSIVLSDWMMPEMDGMELCRRIRELSTTDYCYFILETAKSRNENLLGVIDAGVDDYLMKPIDMIELQVRLKVAQRILALKQDVKSLQSLLPMCAWCKSVRNDNNLWQSVENYLASHASIDFTHAICPNCLEKQMREAERLTPVDR